jgi:hypothetical protein
MALFAVVFFGFSLISDDFVHCIGKQKIEVLCTVKKAGLTLAFQLGHANSET